MKTEMSIFIILMVAKYGMTEENATRNYIINDVTTKTDSQITTKCTTNDLKTEHKELCQEETLDITCPNGTIIIFHDANFGRSSPKPCKEWFGFESSTCNTKTETIATLIQLCNQTSSCKLYVSKEVFGNPCFTTTKYLDVKYSCRHRGCKEHTKSINTYSTSTSYNTIIGNVSSEVTREDQETTVQVEIETTTPPTVRHQSNQQHSLLEERRVLAITGIVLGVILAVIILVAICLVRRRKRLSKSRTRTNTESTEMNALDARRDYAYDYTEFNAHTNNTDHTTPGQQTNGSSQSIATDDNTYDLSGHITAGSQSNPATSTHDNNYDLSGHIAAGSQGNPATWTRDNTYDLSVHVQNSEEPLNSVYGFNSASDTYDDPSNKVRLPTEPTSTYDHFFGEQTEDQYDIASKMETGVAKRTDSVYS